MPLSIPAPRSAPVDLTARRTASHAAARAIAEAPVRFVPADLLDALHGSWGSPEELGLRIPRAVAR